MNSFKIRDEERGWVRGTREAGGIIFVATSNERIVGLLNFHRDKRPQASHGGQLGMSVAGDHRRQGVGRALLEALIAWARSNAVTRIELEVFEFNVPAIRLYEQMGFQIEGRRQKSVVVAQKLIDVLMMARISSIDVPRRPHQTTG